MSRTPNHQAGIAIIAAGMFAAGLSAQPATDMLSTQTGPIRVEHLARLQEPWGMAFLPDGRLLITEKPGRLRIWDDGHLSEPVSGLPAVAYRSQSGLLDVEVDPDFARNGLVYLSYTEAADPPLAEARDPGDPRFGGFHDPEDNALKGAAVARGRLDGHALQDLQVIWRQVPKTIGRGHMGGRLAFAADGRLFITSGDRQRFEPAQDPANNLGKVVRINPNGSIPADNPFLNQPGARPDLWSLGHRNPLGAAIHPGSQLLWIHEMGPKHGDEVNVLEPGQNYGWPLVSNGDNYDGSPIPDHATRPDLAAPAYYWHPSVAPAGKAFYTGSLFATWRGNLLLGGLSSESLLRLTIDGHRVVDEERIGLRRRIRDVIQAPDGAVLVLTDGGEGELLRLTPAPQ
jgi:glucose/arabinose dehydrogenase